MTSPNPSRSVCLRRSSGSRVVALVGASLLLARCFLIADLEPFSHEDAAVDGGGDADAAETCTPDDFEACYTGPTGTEDVGECHGGTRTCQAGGTWGACEGEVTPATQCEGRECGPDGCGESCGGCEAGVTCDEVAGRCQRGAMVLIPAGGFDMGSPPGEADPPQTNEGSHPVTLTRDVEIDRTEVTNQAYLQCVLDGHCTAPTACESGLPVWYSASGYPTEMAHHPVVCVSWDMAFAYCDWMGKRLCTEAEWERACVYTELHRKYPWGNDWPGDPGSTVNCHQAYCFDAFEETAEVGSFLPGRTPVTLLDDMAGNVSEWVMDWYDPTWYQTGTTTDPTGPCEGDADCSPYTERVHRGGNWFFEDDFLRCSRRAFRTPTLKEQFIGIRCCRDATQI